MIGGDFVVFTVFSPPATECIRKLSITYTYINKYGFVQDHNN